MKVKSFVVRRGPEHKFFEQMVEIYKWNEAAFGKEDYFKTWMSGFATSGEDFVEFKFYDETMASAFVFQWNDHCLSREELFRLGILSWSDLND